MRSLPIAAGFLIVAVLLASVPAGEALAQAAPAAKLTTIPKDKDGDIKLYLGVGATVKGAEALGRMRRDAEVILWLAGNQFFAMDDVVHAFQKKNPGLGVGLITLPPGLLLDAIRAGGWSYGGRDYPGLPDVYASVNLGHLKQLRQAGLMDEYGIYMHNELEIMVGKGNPRQVRGIKDLVRPDVKTSMPNPVNEGIMQFYARKVLERHGIWNQIAAGKECVSCDTTPNNWFTAVHHRETPDRIRAGKSDAGIVWKTETLEAVRDGAPVEAVQLPPDDSLRAEVSYAIGALKGSGRAQAAARYLGFLASPDAQAAYARYGFVNATAEELKLKPIPQ